MATKLPAEISNALATSPSAFQRDAQSYLGMNLGWSVSGPIASDDDVWRPTPKALVVLGDLAIDGTLWVKTEAKADDTFLVVLGNVRCRNVVLNSRATLLVAGDVTVDEVCSCTAGDSVTKIAGRVRATVLHSGAGAWLSLYDATQLAVKHLAGYVMAGGKPLRPPTRPDLSKVLVKGVLEKDPDDPAVLRIRDTAMRKLLCSGKSIVR